MNTMQHDSPAAPAEILTESINTIFRLAPEKFVSLEFIGLSEEERQQVIAALFAHFSKVKNNSAPGS